MLLSTALALGVLTFTCLAPGWAAEAPIRSARAADPELPSAARGVPMGGTLRLQGLALERSGAPAALELERFEVWAPDARIEIHGELADGQPTSRLVAPPANAYFRGHIAGEPRSLAVLTVRQDGEASEMRGLVQKDGRVWVLDSGPARGRASGLAVREVESGEIGVGADGFTCANDSLEMPPDLPGATSTPGDLGFLDPLPPPPASMLTASYTARVAIESDYEFYTRFTDAADAMDYIGDLFGYTSALYAQEIDTTLLVSSVSLRTSSSDPWSQTSPLCGLLEFGKYWNDNNTGVDRTLAHFLSGKSNGGGVAWVGALCASSFNYPSSGCTGLPAQSNYGGDYGYSGNLRGNFDIDNPQLVWDLLVVAHEIGHNFNSPHTHCYNGIGGSSEPVDKCYNAQSGCWNGAPSLPCALSGAGCGTVMSYCHLLSPGNSNISFTFGDGHPHGTLPDRVPDRMRDFVIARATQNPSCLAFTPGPDVIFSDGFESGGWSAWSSWVP